MEYGYPEHILLHLRTVRNGFRHTWITEGDLLTACPDKKYNMQDCYSPEKDLHGPFM